MDLACIPYTSSTLGVGLGTLTPSQGSFFTANRKMPGYTYRDKVARGVNGKHCFISGVVSPVPLLPASSGDVTSVDLIASASSSLHQVFYGADYRFLG